jgi:hypothetical protein
MNSGLIPASGLSAVRRKISNSASRLLSMYLLGTTGRNASAAEMYTKGRLGPDASGLLPFADDVVVDGVDMKVSSTVRAIISSSRG